MSPTAQHWPAGMTKYRVVQQRLLERIVAMDVGDRLPSEKELCNQYEVSRITLRQAVDRLVNEGRLSREHGRGTFVTEPVTTAGYPEHFADAVTGFHQQQSIAGHRVTTRMLSQELVPAAEDVASKLTIPVGSQVVKLSRLRYVNGQLHQHVVTSLPHSRFPDVLITDFTERSLYEFLEERYEVTFVQNLLTVSVEEATSQVALNLAVEDGFRLLRIDSLVIGGDGTPVAYGTARHTPDNSEIAINLGAATRTEWEAK